MLDVADKFADTGTHGKENDGFIYPSLSGLSLTRLTGDRRGVTNEKHKLK
jgi:hypothetical protein